jgi:phosphate transport system substrate-binding protein
MAALSFASAQSAAPTISESGSTLMYPLFQAWIAGYNNVDHNLQITAAATGSGTGVAEAIAKHVQIGTSDAYMSDNEAMAIRIFSTSRSLFQRKRWMRTCLSFAADR